MVYPQAHKIKIGENGAKTGLVFRIEYTKIKATRNPHVSISSWATNTMTGI
jgi:hypothetical protein